MAPCIAPESWEDVQNILAHKEYQNLFTSSQNGEELSGDESSVKKIICLLESNPDQLTWMRVWAEKASISNLAHKDIIRAFFETVWHLIRGNIPDARRVLELYQRIPQGAILLEEFTGVPSGLKNRWGALRPCSPLTSETDQDSDDHKEREFVRKNQDVLSSVPQFLLAGNSPLSSPDNSNGEDSSPEESTVCPRSRPGLRRLNPVNYKEPGFVGKVPVSSKPREAARYRDSNDSDSDSGRNEVIRVNPSRRNRFIASRNREIVLGLTRNTSQGSHGGNVSASGLRNGNQGPNSLRRSKRYLNFASDSRVKNAQCQNHDRQATHSSPPRGKLVDMFKDRKPKKILKTKSAFNKKKKNSTSSEIEEEREMMSIPAKTISDLDGQTANVTVSAESSASNIDEIPRLGEASRDHHVPPDLQTDIEVEMDQDEARSSIVEGNVNVSAQVIEETPDGLILKPLDLRAGNDVDMIVDREISGPLERFASPQASEETSGGPKLNDPPELQPNSGFNGDVDRENPSPVEKRIYSRISGETPDSPILEQEPPFKKSRVYKTAPRAIHTPSQNVEITIHPPHPHLPQTSGYSDVQLKSSFDPGLDTIGKILANHERTKVTPCIMPSYGDLFTESNPTMKGTNVLSLNPASFDDTRISASSMALESTEPSNSAPPTTPSRIDSRRDTLWGHDPSETLPVAPVTPLSTRRTGGFHNTPQTQVAFSPSIDGESLHCEPPWRHINDPPSPPNYARGPGESDTHSWRIPHVHADPPSLQLHYPPKLSQTIGEKHARKPTLPMIPPVWAQSRQEICESLSYFRSYQGGVYSRGKKALGYLLDGHPAAHDLWHSEGRTIISHAGGNSAVDKETGRTMLVDDQTESSVSCAALINSYKCGQPIVLIAGSEYNLFPYDLDNRSYVVLGYYLICHAWEEPERSSTNLRGYFVRKKFLFKWIDIQGVPWWIQHTVPEAQVSFSTYQLSPCNDVGTALSKSCPGCNRSSHRIYNFGWVCTFSICHLFFKPETCVATDEEGYCSSFLAIEGEPTNFEASRLDIQPGPPVNLEYSKSRETTTRRFWGGFWCENCGRLSCREYWTHWECSNCHLTLQVKHKERVPGDVTLPTGRIGIQIGGHSGIETHYRRVRILSHTLRCRIFDLPFNRGTIYLIEGNPSANLCTDAIFSQYQRDAEDPAFFRRYCMKSHKLKGRMLSHYFSQNSGEPYKYVGGTDNTVPLDKYSSVKQAISLIRERASVVLGQDPLFNEVLSAAYMSDQKMEFHSDGEKDLGPVVASLSLGAPALMRFRAIPSRFKIDPPEVPDTYIRKTPPVVLTLTLRHGDVLVMKGAEIQEYYQHAVHPSGFRIAATARYIKPEGRQKE